MKTTFDLAEDKYLVDGIHNIKLLVIMGFSLDELASEWVTAGVVTGNHILAWCPTEDASLSYTFLYVTNKAGVGEVVVTDGVRIWNPKPETTIGIPETTKSREIRDTSENLLLLIRMGFNSRHLRSDYHNGDEVIIWSPVEGVRYVLRYLEDKSIMANDGFREFDTGK
jgi:hypothetical protein